MAIKFHHHPLTNLYLRKNYMRQKCNGQVNDNELVITDYAHKNTVQ